MTPKLTRYSPGGYGAMTEDENGQYVRLSEIEPLVQKAIDHAKDSGLLAGSIIADENAEELRKARERISELEDDVKRLRGGVDAFEGLCEQYHDENLLARDLLRWRKVGEEMPEVQGDYHVVIALSPNVSEGVAVVWAGNVVAHPEIFTHWRPIGPMPEGGKR